MANIDDQMMEHEELGGDNIGAPAPFAQPWVGLLLKVVAFVMYVAGIVFAIIIAGLDTTQNGVQMATGNHNVLYAVITVTLGLLSGTLLLGISQIVTNLDMLDFQTFQLVNMMRDISVYYKADNAEDTYKNED